MIEIALNIPEVSEQLELANAYKVDVRWIAVFQRGSEVLEWAVLTDEEVEMGIPQGFLSPRQIYPGALITFEESSRPHPIVAVDLEEEVVHVESVPARPTVGLTVQ